ELRPLGKLAGHRRACPDRRDRPVGRCCGRPICRELLSVSSTGDTRPPSGPGGASRLGVPARAQIPCVLDRPAGRERLKPLTVDAYFTNVALRRAPGMMEERTPVQFYMVSGSVSSAAPARLRGAS